MRKKNIQIIVMIFTLFFITCNKSDKTSEAFSKENPDTANVHSRVTWYTFNEGIKRAKELNKPVVIDFYADWCKWCKVMDEKIFSSADVAKQLNEQYVSIRIHTDKPNNEMIRFKNHQFSIQHFSMMLGVQGLPTLVFMDKDENLITKIPGYIHKEVFLSVLTYIKDECYKQNININDFISKKVICKSSIK